jgi:gliding motility-associated-like protein
VQFTNQSTAGLPNHSWNFGDIYGNNSHDTSSVNNPTHTYSEVGTYNVTLTVSTVNGCSASVTKPIVINEDYVLYVPNAFTPNSDGKNEIFKAEGEGVKDYKLYIYDRWGLLVFYSDDINKGWDGRPQGGGEIVQQDTYVWKILATDYMDKLKNLHGTVTLLK